MTQIIKVAPNEDGNYPFTLYGEQYELQPVKNERSSSKTQSKRAKADSGLDLSPEAVGQPVNDTPQQDPNADQK